MTDPVRFRLVAGAPANAAIGALDLSATDSSSLDRMLGALRLLPLKPGDVALRPFGTADTGVAARWNGTQASLFPHAGPAAIEGVRRWLERAGVSEAADDDPLALYPESSGLIEACALDAIARADSPLAIDAVLAQRDLWLSHHAGRPVPEVDNASQRRLDRLLVAPVVALVGAANIGKSALTNAMARRSVAVVADEPGTTRDHVGVTLDLAGLTVRWVDTPGLRAATRDKAELRALLLARSVIESAALVLVCEDSAQPATPPETLGITLASERLPVLTRCDLGAARPVALETVRTSALTGEGLDLLAHRIREALVPTALLAEPRRWRYHPRLP